MIIIIILHDCLYSNEKKKDVDLGGWKNEKDLGRGGKLINILYKKSIFI